MDASWTDLAGATPGPAESVEAPRELPGVRAWFVVFIVWMGGLAWAAIYLFNRYEAGATWALPAAILALMAFYLSLCNTFLPLPTAWIILLAAAPDHALIQAGWPRVFVVAGVATLSTVIANLTEYHLLGLLFRTRLGTRLRHTRLYTWAVRGFDRAPFALLTLIAFVPIPIDAVRWLAILRRYPRTRYMLAYLVGRGPRYVLFAGCSVLMRFSAREILLIQIGLVVFAVFARLIWRLARRAGSGPRNSRHSERSEESSSGRVRTSPR